MLFSDSFQSIAAPSEGLFRDRGSRFLAYAFPVKSETEFKEHLQALKKEHPAAVHHCYAWRFGAEKLLFRANDDGEPSGSAGKPILGQIQSFDLSNVAVIVVRFFGGSLLGVPGLINAYRTATQEALNAAKIIEVFVQYEYQVHYDADDTSAIMRTLRELDAKIVDTTYVDRYATRFLLKKQFVEQLDERLKELYKTKLELIQQVV